MSRETVADKAERYLLEGRIVLEEVTRHGVTATVRGDSARYRTEWFGAEWKCSCPHQAKSTDCSHIIAVKRVVAIDLPHGAEMTPGHNTGGTPGPKTGGPPGDNEGDDRRELATDAASLERSRRRRGTDRLADQPTRQRPHATPTAPAPGAAAPLLEAPHHRRVRTLSFLSPLDTPPFSRRVVVAVQPESPGRSSHTHEKECGLCAAMPALKDHPKEYTVHDLTQAERRALMAHLLTGRDTFATSQPRVAEWFSDRLCELDDDDIDEGALFDHLEGEW